MTDLADAPARDQGRADDGAAPAVVTRAPARGRPGTPPAETGHRLRRRTWEIRAQASCDSLRAMADASASENAPHLLPGAEPPDDRDGFCIRYRAVQAQLDEAERYLDTTCGDVWWRPSTRIEGAWRYVHDATIGMVGIATPTQLSALYPCLLGEIERRLQDGDPELRAVRACFRPVARPAAPPMQLPPVSAVARGSVQAALTTTYTRIAAEYQRLRRFQGTIFGAVVLTFVMVAVLAGLGASQPQVVPLCFPDPDTPVAAVSTPPSSLAGADDAAGGPAPVTTAPRAALPHPVCPSRDMAATDSASNRAAQASSGGDVGTVLFFGLIGALLTSIPFLVRRAPASSVPILGLRVAQALLKVGLGMLNAVVGLIALRAAVLPGFTAIDTRSQIMIYAVIFGASQHLVTRIVDDRSNALVGTVTPGDDTADA